MHRFRKKSDVKRSEVPTSPGGSYSNHQPPYPIVTQHVQVFPPPEPPTLPPVSDFRTSLILPDLSKRFTLLRASNGNTLNLENLRTRFAEQRAKGAENQISQEEEDMLLDMLSRMRGTGFGLGQKSSATGEKEPSRVDTSAASISSSDAASSTSSTVRQSSQSTLSSGAVHDSIQSPSSPSRSVKRHSNNLFGAGQLRDMRYMRKPASNRTINSNRSVSSTPSESTTGSMTNALIDAYSDGPVRSVSPDSPSSPVIPPSNLVSLSPTRSISPTQEDGLGPLPNPSNPRLSKQLTSSQIHRISVSLEDAIRELEEEAEDQVLVPRTPVLQQNGSAYVKDTKSAFALTTDDVNSTDTAETNNASATMSWVAEMERPSSAGGYRSPSPYRAGGSASPVPRVPGYIPGMPRPVTPARDVDIEDARSLSTTPRASSPLNAQDRIVTSVLPLSASASSLLRQAVNSSPTPYGARPISPHQSVRGYGRSTPEDRPRNGSISTDHLPSNSHWRRPSSPLSTNSTAFQSLNGGSRPSTPSNVTWNVSGKITTQSTRPLGRNGTLLGNGKNQANSGVEDNSDAADGQATIRSRTNLPKTTSDDFTGKEPRSKFLSNGSTLTASALAFVDYDPTASSLPEGVSSPGYDTGRFSGNQSAEAANAEGKGIPTLLTPPSSPFVQKFNSNPLFISSLSNNSSRSSLVSAGSSYHSWEEENSLGLGFIRSPDITGPAWHDVSASTNTSAHNSLGTRGQSASDDPENILRQYTGLSKADLRSIQDKLIDATQNRTRNQEVRAPSTLRRRRPSTAQSFHSNGQPSRTTSPAPVYDMSWNTTDSAMKANELLNSMVDSIKLAAEMERTESEHTEIELAPPPPILAPLPTSSPGRRNKDLAEILFGSSESEPVPVIPEVNQELFPTEQVHDSGDPGEHLEDEPKGTPNQPSEAMKVENDSAVQPNIHESPNVPKDQPTSDQADLVRQVQERHEAAMAQLRRSPQQGRFPTPGAHMTKKKIHLQDISGPLLVQSSTSIDRIPNLPTSPNKSIPGVLDSQRTVKLSFSKRLRNTLRSKNAPPNGDEVTPWMLDNTSASSTNSSRIGDRSLSPSKTSPLGPGSVTDLHYQPKGPTISPPASAGPNLKSFMSRFRKKTGAVTDTESKSSAPSTTVSNSQSQATPAIGRRSLQLPPNSIPLLARSGSVNHVVTPMAPSMSRQTTETPTIIAPTSASSVPQAAEPAALKQFYEAAQSLGLDQSALNDFLARSQPSAKASDYISSEKPFLEAPRATSPLIPEVLIERAPVEVTRSNTLRQFASSPVSATPRRVREIADTHGNYRNTIVRRTIIYPSANGSTPDVTSLVRKSSKSQRRTSNTSMLSNRSIHDRVPTPPPLRAKRQSIDPSPPVPSLPVNFARSRPTSSRLTPETPVDKLNSPYDSFYDMYSGDRSGSVQSPDFMDHPKTPLDDGLPEMEEGQALEVIELANGETIWSIVNGLRADDAESFYPRRGSLDSEYSTMPPHDTDNEQLFFKEHARTGSKSSSISNFSRRKAATAPRPETKVFYSSSANIARLIEQLSTSTEAATFNIKPKESSVPGHSHSGSLQGSVQTDSDLSAHWTVEERLERMLDSVNSAI